MSPLFVLFATIIFEFFKININPAPFMLPLFLQFMILILDSTFLAIPAPVKLTLLMQFSINTVAFTPYIFPTIPPLT